MELEKSLHGGSYSSLAAATNRRVRPQLSTDVPCLDTFTHPISYGCFTRGSGNVLRQNSTDQRSTENYVLLHKQKRGSNGLPPGDEPLYPSSFLA